MSMIITAAAQGHKGSKSRSSDSHSSHSKHSTKGKHSSSHHRSSSHRSHDRHSSHRKGYDHHRSHRGYHRGHSSRSHHSSGSYKYVTKKVWIAPTCSRVWVPARYEYRRKPCGTFTRVLVCAGYYNERSIPGYYDYQTVKVWSPSHHNHHRHSSSRITFSWGF